MQKMSLARRKEALGGYLFILPCSLGFLLFLIYPMLNSFYLSFTDYNGFQAPSYIGIKNFIKMVEDPLIALATKNNLIYAVTQVPLSIALGLVVSTIVFRLPRQKRLFQTLLFFPHITSGVAIAVIWKQLYMPDNGMLNTLLRAIGVANPPRWIFDSATSLYSVILVSIWQSLGFNMIVYLSGLNSIPEGLYEAAMIDGASGFRQFLHITLPLLTPTTFFLVTMGIINSFKVFDLIYQMTSGGPGNSSTVLVHRLYYEGIQNFNFGYACAISLFLFVIVLMITIVQFQLQNRWVFYSEE